MSHIQEVFNRIQGSKKEQKELKKIYKDALTGSQELQQIKADLDALKTRKKQIEESIKSDFKSEFSKLDQIKIDLESDHLLLSDIAINHVMKGELIEIKDEYENEYEPIFNVKFKKLN